MLVTTKPHSSCAPVSKCNAKRVEKKPPQTQAQQESINNKMIPEKLASTCVQMQYTTTTGEACLEKDKHTGRLMCHANIAKDAVPVKKRKKCKHVEKSVVDVEIVVEGSGFRHENGPQNAQMAKTVMSGDDIISWLANVKQSFAQDNTTHTIHRNSLIFAMFTKF